MQVFLLLDLDWDSSWQTGQWAGTTAPCWSSSNMVVPPHLCKQLHKEDRISWIASAGACRVVSLATFLAKIHHGRGP